MAITVPAAGDTVTAAWGASVGNQLNQMFPISVASDVSGTSSSMANITGLSFAVTSGSAYVFNLRLFYTVGGTSTGIVIGYTAPGTDVGRMFVQTYGNASPTAAVSDWVFTEDDLAAGQTTTDGASAQRIIRVEGRFLAGASGTFQLRYARRGTSTTVTVLKGSGGSVLVTA